MRRPFRFSDSLVQYISFPSISSQIAGARNSRIGRSGTTALHLHASDYLCCNPPEPIITACFACNCRAYLCRFDTSHPVVFSAEAGVPKRYIGGSGVSTQLLVVVRATAPPAPNPPFADFSIPLSFWLPFWCTLLAWVFVGLLGLLLRPVKPALLCLHRLRYCVSFGLLPYVLLPIGCATPDAPVLCWRQSLPNKPRTKAKTPRSLPKPFRLQQLFFGMIHCLLGFGHLPTCPLLPHASLYTAVWILQPDAVAAMARPEATGEPVGLPPWDIEPEPLTSQVGLGQPPLPWADEDRTVRASATFYMGELPWQPDPPPTSSEAQWLGVYVYTPHYQPVEFAIKAHKHEGARPILDAIVDCAPGTPDRLFQCAVPVSPQRYPGFFHVLRYPSIIGGLAESCVAVILDLTRVGGRYFATVLPKHLEYHSLLAFLKPLAGTGEGDMCLFIGARTRPWPSVAEVVLRHGDAITVFWNPPDHYACLRTEELFRGTDPWGSMQAFSRAGRTVSVGVLYQDQRYSIPRDQLLGPSLDQSVLASLRLDPASVITCIFPTEGLEIQGHACSTAVAIADKPVHPLNAPPAQRQDIFTYCDLRPLGMRPRCLRTNVPAIHLPTLASDLGIHLPPAFRLGVVGGYRRGDTVRLRGNTTLMFFAEEVDSGDSSSDSHAPPPPQASPAPSGPWEDEVAAPPSMPDATWEDAVEEATHSAAIPPEQQPIAATIDPQAANQIFWEAELSSFGLRFAPPDASGSVYVVPDSQPSSSTPVTAFVFAPDFQPERLQLQLPLPCSVSEAQAVVSNARRGDVSMYFPDLWPATPQPFADKLVFVAAPSWLSNRVVVFFDCRRIDGTLFSCIVHPQLRPGSLLLAAGHRCSADIDIYAHGLVRPLPSDQLVELVPGMLLTLVPAGCGAPATSDLASRLLAADGFEPDALLPEPHSSARLHYFVLTDGMPSLFVTDAAQDPTLYEDIARHLSSAVHLTTFVVTNPAVTNGALRGLPIQGVILATQKLLRLPYPPAREREDRQVLFLDCRLVLQSFLWLLLDGPYVRVQELVNLFQSNCPTGHIVSIIGAPTRNSAQGALFYVPDGTLLSVSFVEDFFPSDHSGHSPPFNGPGDDHTDTYDGPSPDSGDTGASFSRSQLPARPSTSVQRNRSRTPPPSTALVLSGTFGSPGSRYHSNVTPVQVDMWPTSFQHDALVEGTWLVTPTTWSYVFAPQFAVLLAIFGSDSAALCRQLLREHALQQLHTSPAPDRGSLADIGLPACVFPAPLRSRLEDTAAVETASDSTDPPEQLLVRAGFALLTPEFCHETLVLDVLIPQPLQEVLDLIEVCRDAARKQAFPRLVPIYPQPDICWGALLALPSWPCRAAVICVNTFTLQGTLFAVVAPQVVDRYRLLLLAGLPLAAPVNIFGPRSVYPLADGEELTLHTGDCVTFCAPGVSPDPKLSFADLLRTHLPWSNSPPFPVPPADPKYCVVSDNGHCGFKLLPERSMYYKADLAQLLHLQPSLLALQPAVPSICNAADYGQPCATVVAVGESHRQASTDFEQVGMLDCRQVLSGWHRLVTRTGWISLEPIKEALSLQAPTGYIVHFEGCPPHWTWTWLASGQVLVVSFVPDTNDGSLPARDVPSSTVLSDVSASGVSANPFDSDTRPRPTVSMRDTQSRPASTSRRSTARGSASSCVAQRSRLRHLLFAAMLVQSRGIPQSCAEPSLPKVPALYRPVPTPLRNSCTWFGPTLNVFDAEPDSLGSAGSSSFGLDELSAVSPSPLLDVHSWSFTTLLQEAVEEPSCQAMFLAATLLETLFEVLGHNHHVVYDDLQPPPSQAPRQLVLEDIIPLSAFQRQCLALDKEHPHSAASPTGADWLDNDINHVLHNSSISLELRTAFLNMLFWHQEGCPRPESLHVYTDGSASFDPSDLKPASWAFAVFALVKGQALFIGYAASVTEPPCSPYCIGEQTDDALTGELLAACWSLGWAAQFAPAFGVSVEFFYDSQSAGGGVFGLSGPPTGKHPASYERLTSFAIALRHYASTRVHILHNHVQSHTGHLGTELADALAKTARYIGAFHADSLLPLWIPRFARHCLKDWAWAMVPGHVDLPRPFAFEAEALLAQSVRPVPHAAPTMGLHTTRLSEAEATFSLSFVSFNALTLREPSAKGKTVTPVGMRLIGRKAVLKHSLGEVAPHIVGLQETRLHVSECQPDSDYYVFNAEADDRGVGGCSLWISKSRPYGRCGGLNLLFQERDVTVVSTSPRHLTANILTPRLRLHVQVVHAPSVPTAGVDAVRAFWAARASDLARRPGGADYVLLCDANARLGSTVSLHVGDQHADQENEAGTLFHEFLSRVSAFVPSTFAEFQQGPGETWCSPTGHWSRIDYLVLPLAWQSFELCARTLPLVEVLQRRDDHVPVHLRAAFARRTPATSYTQNVRKAVRPTLPQTSQERLRVRNQFALVPVQPWLLDADTHHRQLTDSWKQHCIEDTTPSAPQVTQPFLMEDTLAVIHLRKALRAYLRQERDARSHRWLLIAFAAFRLTIVPAVFQPSALQAADSWLKSLDYSEAQALCALQLSCKTIRRKVAADRSAYLAHLAEQATSCQLKDPRALFQAVRKAFPEARASRRSAFKPLPALLLEDGSSATTQEERNEGWRAHFAAQEAGVKVSPEEYHAHFDTYTRRTPWRFDIQAVPTLRQIEGVVHSLQSRKAVGADSISAELLRADVPSTSRQLLPLLAKSAIKAFEPVVFRGGDLFLLAKRASKVLGCEAYRSILISSVPGKVYHRCLRQQLVPAFNNTKHPFHAGISAGQGIELISITAKTFFAMHNTADTCAALIFFDLKAAFYQVVRQALVDTCESDAGMLELFKRLDLPPAAIDELRHKLSQVLLLEEAGVSEHSRILISDLFQGTFFRLTTDSIVTLTGRGTRPGDPAADLLFAFTLSAYVKSALVALEAQGLLADVQCEASRPDCIPHQGPVSLHCPAWADDFFFPQTGPSFSVLLHRVRASTALLTAHASSLGMTVKFGVDKTAVLLPAELLARHSNLLDRDSEGAVGLLFTDEVKAATCFLPAVHTYRHLGGILTSDSNPSPDLHFRFLRSAWEWCDPSEEGCSVHSVLTWMSAGSY